MTKPDDNISLDWELLGHPLVERCESMIGDVVRYSQSPGGRWLTPDQVKDIKWAIKQVEKRLKDSRPHRKCPYLPNCRRGCKLCDGAGFLPSRMKEVTG